MQKSQHTLMCSIFALGWSFLPLPGKAATINGITPYASLRMQVESVHPNGTTQHERYESLRDAYSRFGLKGHYNLSNNTAFIGQLEIPFDSANFAIRDPYDQGGSGRSHGERLRLAYVGMSNSALGTLTLGQQWMPYYNAIAAPVDMFSSYYSGFATYTVFRVRETIAYVSPSWNGVSFSAGYSTSDGNEKSTSRINDHRIQATASYTTGDTTVALGVDDRGNKDSEKSRIYGASLAQKFGDWYFSAKYERFETDNHTSNSFSSNGNQAVNLFGSYTFGKNTAKLMLAKVKNYGDNIIHMGFDHQFNKDLKFFAEYYYEDSPAALSKRRCGMGDIDWNGSGGKAFMVGFRYDI